MTLMRKYMCLPVAVLVICLLSGCAGLGLLTLAFRALAVGTLIGQISDFFGRDSDEFTLFFDGYDTGIHPNPDRTIDLAGLPAGHHLLTLASNDRRVGFHTHVVIIQNQSINLGNITPIQGGVITGRVMREVGAGQVPLAGVLMAAIFGGGDVIRAATGRQVTLPPQNDADIVIMGFTDANGNYRLGPAQFGQWIVTAAFPAHFADVALGDVSSGDDANDVNLLLKPNPNALPAGAIQGTVVTEGGNAIASALVALALGTPFGPEVDPVRALTLESQLGPLLAQPWFNWSILATQTTAAGAYNLLGPPGVHDVIGFKYGFQAETAAVTLDSGEVVDGDFTLEER